MDAAPPSLLEVRPVAPEVPAAITDDLDLGERAAIALAEAMRADRLLIDEPPAVQRRSVDTCGNRHAGRAQVRCGERPRERARHARSPANRQGRPAMPRRSP